MLRPSLLRRRIRCRHFVISILVTPPRLLRVTSGLFLTALTPSASLCWASRAPSAVSLGSAPTASISLASSTSAICSATTPPASPPSFGWLSGWSQVAMAAPRHYARSSGRRGLSRLRNRLAVSGPSPLAPSGVASSRGPLRRSAVRGGQRHFARCSSVLVFAAARRPWLVHGVRSLLQEHPEWCVAATDCRSAYNPVSRGGVLRAV